MHTVKGFVSIVGAGPWDPELLTLAGRHRLRHAEVVVADYLVNPALLLHCPSDVEIHQRVAGPKHGARLDQDAVNALLVEKARAGRRVVRLKGGDPCMFGRGGEEAQVLSRHGIDFEFVPGVSSPIAAPECAGIPVTHRDHTPAVTFVSGYEAYDKAGLHVQWEHLARSAGTIVLMMSVGNARLNAERLVAAGREPSTPAAVVRWGTRGIQRTVVGQLHDIADKIEAVGIRPPAVLVVGEVVRLRSEIEWFERRPLSGRRVVVTRARHQSNALVRALAEQGADAVSLPCLEVVPPLDPDALDAAVADLAAGHDGVILSSPNGADAFFTALARVGLDARVLAGRVVAVVGSGTAEACRRRSISPDLIPDEAHAEGLLETLERRGLRTKRWLHVRADEGRDVLRPAIEAAGGRYTLAVGYRTIRPQVSSLLVRSLQSPSDGGEGFDAVCFASGRSARHFLETLDEHVGEATARRLLTKAKIVTIGPVTTAAVKALGLHVSATAAATNDAAIVSAVVATLSTRP
jgi:uroporphyrinogen III methyltransferase / synthase